MARERRGEEEEGAAGHSRPVNPFWKKWGDGREQRKAFLIKRKSRGWPLGAIPEWAQLSEGGRMGPSAQRCSAQPGQALVRGLPRLRKDSRLSHQATGDQPRSARPQRTALSGVATACSSETVPGKGPWPPPGLRVQDTPDPLQGQLGSGIMKSAGGGTYPTGFRPCHPLD